MAGANIRAGHDIIRRPGVVRKSGAQTLLTDDEAEANSAAIQSVVEALGGKSGLLETLSVAADQPEVEDLVHLLLDPRYDKVSLRRLCHMAGLTIVDLFAAYKKAMVVKAHLLAYQAITEALLPVVTDVMRRAAPYEIPCVDCGGLGTVTDPTTPDAAPTRCAVCAGQGKLLQLPDLDRQKVALELAQLIQKPGGFTLQQNNLTVPPPEADPEDSRGTFIDLQHAVHELLKGPRQPILDAQVVPAPVGGDPGGAA